MIVSMIAAMAKNRVIGRKNQIPWHLPADLRWFKHCTVGKPVIMGRKTFDSIGRRPLPGRKTIVISSHLIRGIPTVESTPSFYQSLSALSSREEVMIIGGESIYESGLPLARRLYLTEVGAELPGDTYFPDYEIFSWREVYRSQFFADRNNRYHMEFIILER